MRFSVQGRPAVEEPAFDWSELESRLSELASFSSEQPSEQTSKLAVEPHVTLAHDPHDPLAMLEQLNARYRVGTANPHDATLPSAPISNSAPAGEHNDQPAPADGSRAAERQIDPFGMLSLLASIPSKQS